MYVSSSSLSAFCITCTTPQSVKAISIGCFISCSEEEGTIRHARFMDALFSGNSEGVEASDELKVSHSLHITHQMKGVKTYITAISSLPFLNVSTDYHT